MLLPLFSLKYDHNAIFGSSVYGHGSRHIFVLTSNGTLFAYNIDTMKSEWSYLLDCPKINMKCEFKSTPLVINTFLYELVIIGGVYGIDAYSGTLQWQRDDLSSTINHTPIADDNNPPTIYVGNKMSFLLALNSLTGETIFQKLLDGGKVTSPVLLFDNKLFVGTKIAHQRIGSVEHPEITDGFLFALNPINGEEIWRFTPSYRNSFLYSPCHHKDKIITSTFQPSPTLTHYIYAVSIINGKLLWQFATGYYKVLGSPVSDPRKDLVFVSCNNGILYVINGSTGKLVWLYNTYNSIDTTPLISITSNNLALVFGDSKGNIHSLSCITSNSYNYEVIQSHFITFSTPFMITSVEETSDYLLFTGTNGRLNIYNYSSNCNTMNYVDFVPTMKPTERDWYDYPDETVNSGILSTTHKISYLIYILMAIAIFITIIRYIYIRFYNIYQEKRKTRLNISNKKKKEYNIGIMKYIHKIFQRSSYKGITTNDDINNIELGSYYDVSNSSNNQLLQRRGIIINPIHDGNDIDTTSIRRHDPITL